MHLDSNQKQKKTRKIYSAEFKGRVAEAYLTSSATYSEIGRSFGVTLNQVAKWSGEYHNPNVRWVKELSNLTKRDAAIDNHVIQKEDIGSESEHKVSRFTVNISLPSGTKVSISELTEEQLQAVLVICR